RLLLNWGMEPLLDFGRIRGAETTPFRFYFRRFTGLLLKKIFIFKAAARPYPTTLFGISSAPEVSTSVK
ncbi:hypothetical protein PJP10_32480, partial [Mycobacterium kansasii]